MMYDLKRVGKNIRSLRLSVGETQEELGTALYLAKSTINMYETAKRAPSQDILSKIARHYMISLEELMYSDLSDLEKVALNNNVFFENIELVLPIVSSEEAEKNEYFRKAVWIHRKIYDNLHKHSFEAMDKIDDCFDVYTKACDDENIGAEASANLLAVWYLLRMLIKTGAIMMERPAVITQLAATDKKARNALETMEDQRSDFKRDYKIMEAGFNDPECEEYITGLKIRLKQSSGLSYLGDYYLALHYFWNFEDNDLTTYFNRRIGIEMLNAFSSVGNQYAARFLRICLSTMGLSSSQIVDDSF